MFILNSNQPYIEQVKAELNNDLSYIIYAIHSYQGEGYSGCFFVIQDLFVRNAAIECLTKLGYKVTEASSTKLEISWSETSHE
jgi:uncharacterized protein YvpB